MDSKIYAAIIIAVGFVAGIYIAVNIYVANTPFNQCLVIVEEYYGGEKEMVFSKCLALVFNNQND